MKPFEFMNYAEEPSVENTEGKEITGGPSEFMEELLCNDKKFKKLIKKGKKTNKKLAKQGKQIKKVASFGKELGKKVEVLNAEVKEIKRDVEKFKKTARDGLFKELLYCDDVSERKHLIAEIQSTEVTT